MAENFGNYYTTTLASDLAIDGLSAVVTSATGAPAADFRYVLSDIAHPEYGREYGMVTAKSGTTFTVTRGLEGSSARAWSAGATFAHVVTAGTLGLFERVGNKGGASGYAGLDSGSKVGVANLPTLVGDTGSGGTAGIAPAPASGDGAKYLKGDGTWAAPAGGYTDPLTTRGDLLRRGASATERLALGTAGQAIGSDGTDAKWVDQIVTPNLEIDGGGAAITTGVKHRIYFDAAYTLLGWTLGAGQTGSIVLDLWTDSHANYPPTVADTMVGGSGTKPTLSSAASGQDTTLASWAKTSIPAGTWLFVNVDSATTVQFVTLALKLRRAY